MVSQRDSIAAAALFDTGCRSKLRMPSVCVRDGVGGCIRSGAVRGGMLLHDDGSAVEGDRNICCTVEESAWLGIGTESDGRNAP